MQYMLLIYENEGPTGGEPDPAALEAIIARHQAFAAELGAKLILGAGLQPTMTATSVRTIGDTVSTHDGPFAETREQLGGFYLIEAENLDGAVAIARRIPLAADGTIEIRPTYES